MKNQPWYKDGLLFECKLCGNCCSGTPGHVWITDEEIGSIAKYLKIDESNFIKRYIIKVEGKGYSLSERQNSDCVFFNKDYGCVIYNHRPLQCRTWPFWKGIVKSYKTWIDTSVTCPGIGTGKKFSSEEITAVLDGNGFDQ